MADIIVRGKTYTLRASSPMPVGKGKFILHTFMGEENDIKNYLYTNHLPRSEDFRGQGGDYINANFARSQGLGGDTYNGKVVYNPEYVKER